MRQRGNSTRETITFSVEREMRIVSWEQGFFVHQTIASAVKIVEFNIYAVQQDTQSVLMSEFIHQVC